MLERHVLFGSGSPDHEDEHRYGRFVRELGLPEGDTSTLESGAER